MSQPDKLREMFERLAAGEDRPPFLTMSRAQFMAISGLFAPRWTCKTSIRNRMVELREKLAAWRAE
jgi:hypothetical protein